MLDPDILVKTRRETINLRMLDNLDKLGVETTWKNRMDYLRSTRDSLMLRKETLSDDGNRTLKEIVLMLEELKRLSRRKT